MTIITSLAALVWYSDRAGRNAARITHDTDAMKQNRDTLQITQNMAQAEADKPVGKDAVLARLNKGDA